MHRITLSITLLLAATCADAAWYQKTDGTIVDPIQIRSSGGDHSYSGNNLESHANLTGADLQNAYLFRADLEGANLTNAYLGEAFLGQARLMDADLTGADLSDAWVRLADLTGADLSGSDMTGVDLSGADLINVDLDGADLSGALLGGTDLSGANLSGSNFSDLAYHDEATGTTWTDAFYYTDNEPTWDSDMDAAWRTSVGILAVAPTNAVPEPSTLLLALLGLALLPRKRRR